jgi:uncharacterized protein DUF4124
MIGVKARGVRAAALAGLLVLSPALARATVYSWKGDDGVLMVSNNPEDVPEDKRASVRSFTSKPAPKRAREEEEAAAAASGEAAAFDAYQRGFERGLEAAEREVAFAERLAASIPQAPPVPIVIAQPAAPAPYDDYSDYSTPYSNYPPPFYAAYAPYPFFTVGVAGRFGRHRHFLPGAHARGRRVGVPFSRAAFGQMR